MTAPPAGAAVSAPPNAYGRRHRIRWGRHGRWRLVPAAHVMREAIVPVVLAVGLVAWAVVWLWHGDLVWGWTPLAFAALGGWLARHRLAGAWGSYLASDGSLVVRARPHASAATEEERVFGRREILHYQTRAAESGAEGRADLVVEVDGYHGPWRHVLDRDWPRDEAELVVSELERGLGHFAR